MDWLVETCLTPNFLSGRFWRGPRSKKVSNLVSKLTWCLTSTETTRIIRDGEKGGGVWRWGRGRIIYLSLHCHHQNDSCIKMGSDESHFNVSVGSDGQSHMTVSTNHNLSERVHAERCM